MPVPQRPRPPLEMKPAVRYILIMTMSRVLLSSLLLLSIASTDLPAAAMNARAGRELPLASPRYVGQYTETRIGIAASPRGALVAWVDRRGDVPQLVAVRLDEAGVPMDHTGLLVGTSAYIHDQPLVWWNGTDYLVIWNQQNRIAMRKVSADGVLGAVFHPPIVGTAFAIAGRGNEALLLTTQYPVTTAVAIDADGETLGSVALPAGTMLFNVVVAADADSYLVAGASYCNTSDVACKIIRVFGVDSRARLIGTGEHLLQPLNSDPLMAAASSGQEFGVFVGPTADPNNGVRLYRFGDTAQLLGDPAPVATSARLDLRAPAVVFRDGFYELAWSDYAAPGGTVFTARVDTAGHVVGISTLVAGDDAGWPSLATSASATFLATRSNLNGSAHAGRVEPGAQTFAPVELHPVSNAAVKQLAAAVATNAKMSLNVWMEGGYPNQGLRAARVVNGAALDGSGLVISENEAYDPSVATDGTNFLVVWRSERSAVVSRLVTPEGELLPISVIEPGGGTARVVWNGSEFIIFVAQDQILAVHVAANGERQFEEVVASASAWTWSAELDASYANGTYLLAAAEVPQCSITCPALPVTLFLWHFNSSLQKIHPEPVKIAEGYDVRLLDATTNGNLSAIFWRENEVGVIQRISREGEFLDAEPIAVTATAVMNGAIQADANRFVFSYVAVSGSMLSLNFGRLIGAAVETAELLRFAPATDELLPWSEFDRMQLTIRGAGKYAVSYTRYAPEAEYGGVRRLFTRDVSVGRTRSVR